MAYVALEEFKVYVRSEIGTIDDGDMAAVLSSAEDAVDDYCGRSFDVAGSGSARVYVPTGTNALYIHDATTITSVVDDGTTLTSGTDYQKEPINGLVGAMSVPYYRLRRLSGSWDGDGDEATISVTATWGWTATPERVKQATKMLAKELLEARNNKSGYVELGDMAARALTHPKFAMLLDRLRRYDVVGGFA